MEKNKKQKYDKNYAESNLKDLQDIIKDIYKRIEKLEAKTK